ncbi:Transmembrane protein [Hirschfeldia incana]|nr:Transmembrane protein [Hirschfeldia incana]
MTTFELFQGVEAEKAEAMRRYNNQRYFRNITRACAVALLFYLWFPTVTVSLLAVGDWFYRTGAVIVTNRTVVFVSANLLVALVFLLSRDRDEESSTKPDLYDQYTSSSSSAVIVPVADEKVVDVDGSKNQTVAAVVEVVVAEKETVAGAAAEEVSPEKQTVPAVVEEVVAEKQIVPAFKEEKVAVEEVVAKELKRTYRRTKSERKKKVNRPATAAFRRTESANSGIERLSSEEFRLKIEAFIMEKKRCLVQEENGALHCQERSSSGLELVGADSSYGSY